MIDLAEQDELKALAVEWLLDSDYAARVARAAFEAAGHQVRDEQTTWNITGWFTHRMQVQLKQGTSMDDARALTALVQGLRAQDISFDTEPVDMGNGFAQRPSLVTFTMSGRSRRVKKQYRDIRV